MQCLRCGDKWIGPWQLDAKKRLVCESCYNGDAFERKAKARLLLVARSEHLSVAAAVSGVTPAQLRRWLSHAGGYRLELCRRIAKEVWHEHQIQTARKVALMDVAAADLLLANMQPPWVIEYADRRLGPVG